MLGVYFSWSIGECLCVMLRMGLGVDVDVEMDGSADTMAEGSACISTVFQGYSTSFDSAYYYHASTTSTNRSRE